MEATRLAGTVSLRRLPWAENRRRRAPRPGAKLQATGLDRAGRRQYLYHPAYRAQLEQAKFDKLIGFAEKLPDLRAAMAKHIEQEPLSFEWTAAVALRVINLGWFRVGDARYAKTFRTFGITTLHKGHVRVRGSRIAFRYRNGDGFANLTGQRLNDYIREHMGDDFTAKDFRTWGGTLLAAIEPAERDEVETETERKRTVAAVMRTVGERLGNTPAVARASYVSPAVGRAVSRRTNDRRFPATAFARRRRPRYGARSRGARAAQPAPFVANSPRARDGIGFTFAVALG